MSLENNYIITKQIASGSMGTISKAVQKSLDRAVAIKMIHPHLSNDPKFVNRLEREAKAAAVLEHMNIMSIIDFGKEGDRYFIVAEYIDGPSLGKIIENVEHPPLEIVLSVVVQTLNGLGHAHNRGVIHRDIKPDNIMFNSQGLVKITDFGIAKTLDLPSITLDETIGTPSYMSPEQAQGKSIDQRSDLFSVGVILYRMVTGVLPFEGDNIVATLKKIEGKAHTPVKVLNPDIPERMALIVDRALEKDPTKRFYDATEFMHALRSFSFKSGVRYSPVEIKKFLEATPEIVAETKTGDTLSSTQIKKLKAGAEKERPTVAILPLTGCFGCQVNLLDLHERFHDLRKMIDIRFTYLMDVKDIPKVDIGIVEGCVANSENENKLKALRENCDTLIALGTCACFGGIPGLRNLHKAGEVMDRAYKESESTVDGEAMPSEPAVPKLTDRVRTVPDTVTTDIPIPGCPSPHRLIMEALNHLIDGTPLEPSTHALCFECKRTRKEMLNAKREFIADEIRPIMEVEVIDPEACFLEQGILCMGMTTRAGCGSRCVENNRPCTGCMGPAPHIRETGAKWVNTLGSLLPGGDIRFRHDLVGLGYCYTLPVSMMPYRKDS